MTTLLKSATIIDTTSAFHKQTKDILIIDGIISEIEDNIPSNSDYNEINLENLHISKGWFDSSVCLGEPGYEERETIANGVNVAGKSGFTQIAVNPYTSPIVDNKSAVEFLINKANQSPVSVLPIGALTQKSEGIEMAELYDMQQSGAIAFGDYKRPIENDNLLKIALLYAQNFNGLVLSFPKNKKIAGEGIANEGLNSTKLGLKGIPSLAEEIQVARDLFLLEYTGGRLHIPTISTAKSVALIRQAKSQGLNVTCSVAVHNLVITDDALHGFDANNNVNPPLRTDKDVEALLEGVKDGTIDIITSDHNPIDVEHKKVEFSISKSGSIGMESAFGALLTKLDLETVIQCFTENPKKIFGIENTAIEVNSKANISLFNPELTHTFTEEDILSTSKNSIFIGHNLKGKAYGVYAKNQLLLNT
ncbi:MAG: dihydroorotase [Tenacibaculum sp.]|nr:dihydroorotase [Tenacibaculum sp.]